jgi:2-alkyl-3-oxoalkanoate reductase
LIDAPRTRRVVFLERQERAEVKVFVAGATGAIGRPLVRQLVEAGHEVVGMTRTPEKAAELRRVGAEPAVCDALDPRGVRAALERGQPEVIVNELTDLPPRFDPRARNASTDRLRTEGTRTLLDAAVPAGARRMVCQSLAYLYAPEGDWVKDEDARPFTSAPGGFGEGVRALLEMEDRVMRAPDVEGVVLRYGLFYGPGTYLASDGSTAEDIRRRRFPVVGRGSGIASFVHVEDAAAATVAAVEHGRSGVYNVVDDEPAPVREWLPEYAEVIGAPPPRRVPKLLARLATGRLVVMMGTEGRGASNEKAKGELRWKPRHPSWRQGFREALG